MPTFSTYIIIYEENKHWIWIVAIWNIKEDRGELSIKGNECICISSPLNEFANKMEYEGLYSTVGKSPRNEIFINSINIIAVYWPEEV